MKSAGTWSAGMNEDWVELAFRMTNALMKNALTNEAWVEPAFRMNSARRDEDRVELAFRPASKPTILFLSRL
jgi:hypothetical protein